MHNVHAANCHIHGSGERNGAQRRTKVSFTTTMMQALKLLWLVSWDETMLNSEEIKPVALTIIELRLSEGIS